MRTRVNGAARQERTLGALEAILGELPFLTAIAREVQGRSRHFDAVLDLRFKRGPSQRWIVESRTFPVEPREAESQALSLREAIDASGADYAVLVAPFVSKRSAEILARARVGFCDASGNCRLVSGPIYIERSGFPNAFARKASHGSLFTPRSERVLRALLDPGHAERVWTLRELANRAFPGVSLGQVHKVIVRLEQQAFVQRTGQGLVLVEGEKLLRLWATEYRSARSGDTRYYSPLANPDLIAAFVKLVGKRRGPGQPGLLASFTAAEVLAPHVRQHRFFAYWADDRAPLEKTLQLKRVSSGENVVVYDPYDPGALYPATQSELPVTSHVQTYLDLAAAGRGEEAAQAVLDRWLKAAYRR